MPKPYVPPAVSALNATRIVVAWMSLAVLLSTGCAKRIPMLTPRLDNSVEHRSAKKTSDCLGCHTVSDLPPGHSGSDYCFRCHKFARGTT